MKSKEIIEKLANIPYFYPIRRDKSQDMIDIFWNATGRNELYNLDPETKRFWQVTKGEIDIASCVRFPEENAVIFGKDKNGDEHYAIYQLDLERGTIKQLTTPPTFHEGPYQISPDRKYLLFNSSREGKPDLFKMDLMTHEITQLTDHKNPFHGFAFWSSNGWIYHNANDTPYRRNFDVWAVKEDGSELKKIYSYSDSSMDYIYDLSKDGQHLVIGTKQEHGNTAGIMNLRDNSVRWYGGKEKYDEKPVEISDDNSKLLVIRFQEIERLPVIYDVNTGEERTISIRGTVRSATFSPNSKYLIYARSDPTTPESLVRYDLKKEQEEMIVRPELALDPEIFIDAEYIKYPSFDGLEIPAVLYKPAIPPGEKAPAIVYVPGGPGGQFSLIFANSVQIFALAGYVVLGPSIRGSIGFGKEYFEKNIMDLGGGDAKDVIYGKKYLESLSFVDPNKIAVFGGSYGGYMAYLQLTKYADAGWDAGIAWVGITHWKTMYDRVSPGYQHFLEGLLGKYEDNKALWEDRSPLTHVEKIKAPILMLQGLNDPRCPVQESRQFRDKLVQLGKKEGEDFEYQELGKQGHGNREAKKFNEMMKKVITFLKKRF